MTAVSLQDLNKAGGNLTDAKKPKRGLLEMLADPRVKNGMASVVGNAMKPERMLQLCLAAAKGNPKLLQCSPASVLGAMMSAAALGLEPNTPQQQAFLIPYAKRGKNPQTGKYETIGYECQFQIGYRGYITLAHRSPQIDYLQAECIHENDVFEHIIGTNTVFKYQKKLANRGPAIGAFAYVKFKNGTEAACVLPLDELEKIRECSETYTSLRNKAETETGWKQEKAKKSLAETPWVMWFDDMAAKSAIKKLAKQLPLEQGSVLSAAQQLDTAGESGRVIDMEKMAEPSTVLSIVQDGFAPPEIDATEGEFVEAGDDDDTPPAAEAPAASEPPIEGEFLAAAPEQDGEQQEAPPVTLIGLITRASKATDTDELMSILADGTALPPTDQKKLQRAINGRRAELESGGQMSLG